MLIPMLLRWSAAGPSTIFSICVASGLGVEQFNDARRVYED